jgi:hypothetical protein
VAMTCEDACLFTGCRAHGALMGDGGTGSFFLSSDPPDATEVMHSSALHHNGVTVVHNNLLYIFINN